MKDRGNFKIKPRNEHMKIVSAAVKDAFYSGACKEKASYFDFLYSQSLCIGRRWWLLQFALLAALYIFMSVSESSFEMRRIMGVAAPFFVIMIIPEMWKNRYSVSMEIEGAAYYSLRDIYAARMLLFAFADGLLLAVFSAAAVAVCDVSIYHIIVEFFLPMMVTCCICFRTLYSRFNASEYLALFFSVLWTGIWVAVIIDGDVYEMISAPVWICLCIIAVLYLVYVIGKVVKRCDSYWEVDVNWN